VKNARKSFTFIFILLMGIFLAACSDDDRLVDAEAIFSKDFDDELTIHFFHLDLPEKAGESIFIEAANGKTVLIDAGIPEAGEIVDDYLEELGIEKIDYVLPSHPHIDHIGGLHTIFETREIGEVLEIDVPHDTRTYEKYKQLMEDHEIPFDTIEAGDKIELDDDLYMEVLNPPKGTTKDSLEENYSSLGAMHINNVSEVVRLVHGDNSFLFTGDIYQSKELELIEEYGEKIKSDVLVAPHHGDGTSSHIDFIEAVDPDIAVIASNINFNEIVNERYEDNHGSELFHNAFHGNILLRSDGKKIRVIMEKEKEE